MIPIIFSPLRIGTAAHQLLTISLFFILYGITGNFGVFWAGQVDWLGGCRISVGLLGLKLHLFTF